MNVYYNSHHNAHCPPNEIFNGNRDPHQEIPDRVDHILNALGPTKHLAIDVQPNPSERKVLLEVLSQIHTADYLNFLQATDFVKDYVYPSVFSYREERYISTHPIARRGLYSFDTYTPINNTTFKVALSSAYLAQRAALEVLHNQKVQYALCRPPGHHAEPSYMGGYCYLNNGAVAAQTLINACKHHRVAILDVDFHHGNGAEKIFGQREDVLTVSIHADPNLKFPYFSGQVTTSYIQNLNFPIPLGTTNGQYQHTLKTALQIIQEYQPSHLVVCFGADTHESDPIGGFKLTTSFYAQMAHLINELKIPIVIVQEGGYNHAALGINVATFLSGFESSHHLT